VREALVHAFATMFVVVDPIGLVPVFIALTHGAGAAERRRTGLVAVTAAGFVLLAFAVAGGWLLAFFGIGIPAFRIAGGIMLFLIALEMLFARRTARREREVGDETHAREDVAVFPLAIPLIAGPGSIASIVLLGAGSDLLGKAMVVATTAVVLAIAFVMILFADSFERVVGPVVIRVLTRLFGMLLGGTGP